MGSGSRRKKRHGKRPRSKPRVGRKLTFLCDQNLERTISDAVGRIPGYAVRTAQQQDIDQSHDAGYVKVVALELKAVILTRDRDFLDEDTFPPGSPPGVLRIDLPRLTASEIVERLTTFLASSYAVRCKKATVVLQERTAEIRARRSGRVVAERVVYDASPPIE